MPHSRHNELAITLSDGLDRQIAVMETLRTCLEEEHRALQSRDPEQLLSVAERKTACLSDAGRISRLCQELEVREAAQTPTTSGGAVSRRREQLDTLTRMCHDLNNVNGSLIRRQKTRVEKTLQIMHGEPEHSNVYGPSGVTAGRNSTRRILASI
jgi:flagellar biosynthesis/type III secretory pathway chaperone